MSDKDVEGLVETLYPFFIERFKKESVFRNCVKRKNASVVSVLDNYEDKTNIGKNVEIVFPYDTTSVSVRNETGADLTKGDLVCIEYSIDLKNAIAVYKVN